MNINEKFLQVVIGIIGNSKGEFLLSTRHFSRKFTLLIAIIFILPILGLSDHWKTWNINQKNLINNIQTNQDLKIINENDMLLISGNIYSKLGLFSHIEFFSMPWVVNSIFHETVKSNNIISLTSYIYLDETQIIDPKFNRKIELTENIFIYDSVNNKVNKINKFELNKIIKSTDFEIRHWIQLLNNKGLKSSLLYISPRLKYLFEKNN